MEAATSRQTKPALITVDDDPVARGRWSAICGATTATATRCSPRSRGRRRSTCSGGSYCAPSPAMMVADQRMPGMSGVEFLEQALQQAPDAKRVLLTAYADKSAAITAINDA